MRKKTSKSKIRRSAKAAPQARVWITEFKAFHTQAPAPIATLPAHNKHPPLDLRDGLAHSANLDPETAYIRIIAEVQCAFSTTGDASIDDILIPRLHVEYFVITGDKVISFIAAP